MKSKRAQEGYLLIDHRSSPGLPDDIAVPSGLPAGVGRGMAELPTITCSHCQFVTIMNPLRTRERGYCPKCDHYICDKCNLNRVLTGECKTFNQRVDEAHERVIQKEQQTLIRLV